MDFLLSVNDLVTDFFFLIYLFRSHPLPPLPHSDMPRTRVFALYDVRIESTLTDRYAFSLLRSHDKRVIPIIRLIRPLHDQNHYSAEL